MADDALRQMVDYAIFAVSGLGITGSNVFEDPAQPIADGKLPAIAVEPLQDIVEHTGESNDPGCIDRHQLRLRFTAIGTTPAQRDAVMLELKLAVLGNTKLGTRRRYEGVAAFPRSGEGQRDFFAAQVMFDIEFFTYDDQPDVLIEPGLVA